MSIERTMPREPGAPIVVGETATPALRRCLFVRSFTASSSRAPSTFALLEQLRRLTRQICCNPQHVVQMLRPRILEPSVAVAVAAPQQRLQLLQFVFEEVRCAGAVRGGRGVGGYRRGRPGYSSSSHLVCLLSKVSARHVVRRLGCLRIPAVAFCASRSHRCGLHRWPAAKRSGSSVSSAVCGAFHAH